MSEDSDFYRSHREHQKVAKKQKQDKAFKQASDFCIERNIVFEVVSDWQLRIKSSSVTVDVYSNTKKYHIIKPSNQRGFYKDLKQFLEHNFK